jgi:hypothetical protein
LVEEAFHGPLGEFVCRVEPETEADPAAVLVQLLVAFGNAAGRHAYWKVGPKRHYANLYACLVGPTATGRKGSAWSWVEHLMARCDSEWSRRCVAGGLSSGEGLVYAVRDPVTRPNPDGTERVIDAGAVDKRLMAAEEEFGQTLRASGRQGSILSMVLRQAWDGGTLATRTRRDPLRATEAHVSLIGHVTREELRKTLSATEKASGLANRILWVASRRSKLLPDGGDLVEMDDLVADLTESLRLARTRTEIVWSHAAHDCWYGIYPRLEAERPGPLGLCTSRAAAQVLRLALVYALVDHVEFIAREHLEAAAAVWDYCERSCRWVFGEGVGDADADAILAALKRAGERGLSGREIHELFNNNRSAEKLGKALSFLEEGGLAQSHTQEREGPGRRAVRWYYTGVTN